MKVGIFMAEMSKKENIIQAVKFCLFSMSAGIIQILSFTLLNELVVPNINVDNEKVMKILSSEYGVCYLIALVLSVIWNFTFNRKFTFKSATNVPIAMLKVFGFYCVFTPVSTIIGELVSRVATAAYMEYVILGVTMLANMITEFIFCKKYVFVDDPDDSEDDEDEESDDEDEEEDKEKTEEEKKAEREAEREAEKEEKEAIQQAKKKARKLEKKKIKKAKKKAKKKEKKEMKKAKKKAEKKAAKEAEKRAKKEAEKAAKKVAKESEK